MIAALRELLAEYCKHSRENGEESCSDHDDAPHGFNRDQSHSEDRYVCDCEYWSPNPEESAECVRAVFNALPALLAKSAAYDALVAELEIERDLHNRIAHNFDHYSKEWVALKDAVEAAEVGYVQDCEQEGRGYELIVQTRFPLQEGQRVRLLVSDDRPSHTAGEK